MADYSTTMKHFSFVFLLALFSAGIPASDELPMEYRKLWNEAAGYASHVSREYPDYIQVVVLEVRRMYFFTREAHPAHPAVVIRNVVESDGRIVIQTGGYAFGSRAEFELWLDRFKSRDAAIREQLESSPPHTDN